MNDALPAHTTEPLQNYSADGLREWVRNVFVAAGCSAVEAQAIADGLVQANLYGHDSHGIGLVPQYLGNIKLDMVRCGVAAIDVSVRSDICVDLRASCRPSGVPGHLNDGTSRGLSGIAGSGRLGR